MELALDQAEADHDTIARPARSGRGGCPLENPDVKPITEELLLEPHPGEPGVDGDGIAAPLENPGR
jgi:hypothetical protein